MQNKVARYKNIVEPFHCDVNHKLFMGHLGNHMLNAADFHSTERGFGMRFLNTINKTWVLSRLTIEMTEMPQQYEEFYIETWVETAMRYFTNRNFRVVAADGRILGYGRSVWALIDLTTRQPCNLMDICDGDLVNWVEKDEACPIARPSRVKMTGEAPLCDEMVAHYSDIDVNGHFNSVKYIEHILDLFPLETYKTKRLSRFDIAYVAESHSGDTLRLYKEQTSENEYQICMSKLNADNTESECVRSSVKFE